MATPDLLLDRLVREMECDVADGATWSTQGILASRSCMAQRRNASAQVCVSSPGAFMVEPLPTIPTRVAASLVDWGGRQLARPDRTIKLTPKAVAVLHLLLVEPGRTVTRRTILDAVWPGSFSSDEVLTQVVAELRRAFGDDAKGKRFIVTIPKLGYRWIGPAPESAQGESDAGVPVLLPQVAPRRSAAWAGALVVALLAAGLAVGAAFRRSEGEQPARRLPVAATSLASAVVTPPLNATPFSTDPGDEAYAAISPDGTLVAIAAKHVRDARYRLYLRDLDGGGERLLLHDGEGDELAPTWSRDGRSLVYFRIDGGDCVLEIADVLGLSRRALASCVPGLIVPAEFLPDGSAVLVPSLTLPGSSRNTGFARIELESGRVSNYDYGGAPVGFELEARFSPDGSKLLVQHGVPPFSSVTLIDLDRKHPQSPSKLGERFSAINGMTWLSDNRHAVVASDSAGVMELLRVDTVSGEIERFGGLSGRFPSAAGGADLLVYSRLDRSSGLTLFNLQAGVEKHAQRPMFASTRAETSPAIAPRGDRLAFVSDRSGSAQIYLGDWTGETATRVSEFHAGRPYDLSFSSDGSQLAFGFRLDALTQVWIMDLGTRATSEPELGVARTIDLRFGGEPEQLLYAAWDENGRPHVYSQQQHDPKSARRMTACEGRSPRSGGDGWVYFFAPDDRMLKRVRGTGVEAACEAVSDRVRWLNRNAWAAGPSGVIAVLTPLDRVARAGLYRLSEPPQLLLELPELMPRPAGNLELVGDDARVIAALPVSANADVWLVRGVAPSPASR